MPAAFEHVTANRWSFVPIARSTALRGVLLHKRLGEILLYV